MKILVFMLLLVLLKTDSVTQVISPYLFGQNHWLAQGDEGRNGYLQYLWPKVKESGVKSIRVGGNHYNKHFPERHRLNAMIDSILHIGAEPILQVPQDFTAIQAMELVEYYTRKAERKVKFWSIGNEPMHKNATTIEQVHAFTVRIATAMKKVNPDIKIFVFDESDMREKDYAALCGGRLDITGLKENGAWLIDGFNFHRYPNGRTFNRDNVVFSGPDNIRQKTILLKKMMESANVKHGRTGDGELLWGLTEVNVTYANPDREISGYGNTSFLGGQFIAEIYGIGMEYGAFSVNPWCINETDAVSTDFGYLGLPREFYPRSSYYHTMMMAEHMKGAFMYTSCNQKYVTAIGNISQNEICVLILNRDENTDFDYEILLSKSAKSNRPLVIRADASIDARYNGRIEKQSSVLLVFDAQGGVIKQLVYGLKHNLRNEPPELISMK